MLEVAVVVLDGATLKTIDEFDTLLNTMRDVGRSDTHVDGRMAAHADCVAAVEPQVLGDRACGRRG